MLPEKVRQVIYYAGPWVGHKELPFSLYHDSSVIWLILFFSLPVISVVLKSDHITNKHKYWRGSVYREGLSDEDG